MKEMKKFEAFTLIEMLVVMGILVILMTMGIAAGRFAIQRANLVQHQNAVTQIYQGLQAYYADNRKYPEEVDFATFGDAMSDAGELGTYLDSSGFDGGTDGTFYYFSGNNNQNTLVCVTLGGLDDEGEAGIVCDGNGFGVLPESASYTISEKSIEPDFTEYQNILDGGYGVTSDWVDGEW